MTNTTPESNFESLFPEAILVQITVSVRKPAGNRWYAQIKIIWGAFMYKVSNFKGMGTEWGKSQEIVQESGGSSGGRAVTINHEE